MSHQKINNNNKNCLRATWQGKNISICLQGQNKRDAKKVKPIDRIKKIVIEDNKQQSWQININNLFTIYWPWQKFRKKTDKTKTDTFSLSFHFVFTINHLTIITFKIKIFFLNIQLLYVLEHPNCRVIE